MSTPPQYAVQQAGKFAPPRKAVVITHPDTREVVKLDKRGDKHGEGGLSSIRSHPNAPAKSQAIPSYTSGPSPNFYPNSFNSSYFVPGTSLSVTNAQGTPSSHASKFNPVSQGPPASGYGTPSFGGKVVISVPAPNELVKTERSHATQVAGSAVPASKKVNSGYNNVSGQHLATVAVKIESPILGAQVDANQSLPIGNSGKASKRSEKLSTVPDSPVAVQQAGKFAPPRKAVVITHPDTREVVKLDKRGDKHRKPGRSGNSSGTYQRSYSNKNYGGSAAGSGPPRSVSSNRSFKKTNNVQGGQPVVNPQSTVAPPSQTQHNFQNYGIPEQQHIRLPAGTAVNEVAARAYESSSSSSQRSNPVVPKGPSQSAAMSSDALSPMTPVKEVAPKPVAVQFVSIRPGFVNGMQIPARTSSTSPNMDEQQRNQARIDSFRAVPTAPVPAVAKPQLPGKEGVATKHVQGMEPHSVSRLKKEHQVSSAMSSSLPQKPSIIPMSGIPMQNPFHQQEVHLPFGGINPPIQPQGVPGASIHMPLPMHYHMGNAPQLQHQMFMPNIQPHPMQHQSMMHQGQGMNFPAQMGPHTSHQLNHGMSTPPQYAVQQAGKFAPPRKAVVIIHPDTRDELKLDKRGDKHGEGGLSSIRSHPDEADVATPKAGAPDNGEHHQELIPHDSGNFTKKYSRAFLLKFQSQIYDLPEGFSIAHSVANVLLIPNVNKGHLDRDSYPSTGRHTGGGSRLDRHGPAMDDDKCSKAQGHFVHNRDYVNNAGGYKPAQGGNFGVLRNPRQTSGHAPGVNRSGPSQSINAMHRNNTEDDRWLGGSNFQKDLIPSPQIPSQLMHKAEKKYEVGKVADEEQAKQRRLKGILNKPTPQNFEKLFEQVKAVSVDSAVTLTGVRAESSMRRANAGEKMSRTERGRLLSKLEMILEAEQEQRKRINRLARALRYPSDDEGYEGDEEEGIDEDSSN